jgi:hypothetical protein
MAWGYVVQNLDGHFYIGMTTDLEARIRDLAGSDHQTRSWGVTEHSASRVPKEFAHIFQWTGANHAPGSSTAQYTVLHGTLTTGRRR